VFQIIAFMVLAIICCVLAPIQLTLAAAGANNLIRRFDGAQNCHAYNSQLCNDVSTDVRYIIYSIVNLHLIICHVCYQWVSQQ